MADDIQIAIGILQAIAVLFPVWIAVSQYIVEKADNLENLTEFVMLSLITSTYGGLILALQNLIDIFKAADASGPIIDSLIWIRVLAALIVMIVVGLATRNKGAGYYTGTILVGSLIAIIMYKLVKWDAVSAGMTVGF